MGNKTNAGVEDDKLFCTFCAQPSCHPHHAQRNRACCAEHGGSDQDSPEGRHRSASSRAPGQLLSTPCWAGGAGRLAAGQDVPVLAHVQVLGREQRGCRRFPGSKGKTTPAVRTDCLGLGCKGIVSENRERYWVQKTEQQGQSTEDRKESRAKQYVRFPQSYSSDTVMTVGYFFLPAMASRETIFLPSFLSCDSHPTGPQ